MTGRDDGRRTGGPDRGLAPEPADTVELGDRRLAFLDRQLAFLDRRLAFAGRRPPRIAVILAVAGLVIGLAAGYAAGARHARGSAAPGQRSGTSTAGSARPAGGAAVLNQSTGQCSAQAGHKLQLGIQIINQSGAPVMLRRVTAVTPQPGLRAIAQAWGPCGELPAAGTGPADALLPGASGWLTVTFRVLVPCPAAYPVQFAVRYDWLGRLAHSRLPGFNDLASVPYTGCRAGAPG
jgi:hypothetical protein